jgi:AcrR family transcriptional regulator
MAKDVRTRILDAAERLFYEQGITATGVDALAEAADVSKRTLYNHFGSKEGVVTAYLRRRDQRWQQRVATALEGAQTPTERILAYANSYCDYIGDNDVRGCAFINASAELSNESHPGVAVIRESIDTAERGLSEILAEAGIEDPEELAGQILVVLEGAMSVAGMRRNNEAYDTAERLILSLIASRMPVPG